MKHNDVIFRLIERAYLSGFQAAGEGWNGEYPFYQYNKKPEADSNWLEQRKNDLQVVLEAEK